MNFKLLQNQQKKELHPEEQVKEQNNEMTSFMGFNKAESANFIFDCVQYLMPKEGKSSSYHVQTGLCRRHCTAATEST